jgi:hypothetical protein
LSVRSLAVALRAIAVVVSGCRDRPPREIRNSIRVVEPEEVLTLESRLKLPRGAWPLEEYDRHYTAATLVSGTASAPREVDAIVGVLLHRQTWSIDVGRPGASPVVVVPNAFIVTDLDSLPHVDDGGCAVITLAFNRTTKRFVRLASESRAVACNGRF